MPWIQFDDHFPNTIEVLRVVDANRSRAQVDADRAAAAERKRIAREKAVQRRRAELVTPAPTTTKHPSDRSHVTDHDVLLPRWRSMSRVTGSGADRRGEAWSGEEGARPSSRRSRPTFPAHADTARTPGVRLAVVAIARALRRRAGYCGRPRLAASPLRPAACRAITTTGPLPSRTGPAAPGQDARKMRFKRTPRPRRCASPSASSSNAKRAPRWERPLAVTLRLRPRRRPGPVAIDAALTRRHRRPVRSARSSGETSTRCLELITARSRAFGSPRRSTLAPGTGQSTHEAYPR
jgi:hypothetical protein